MSEKNSNTNSWVRRQKDAPTPSYVEPLNRQAKPEISAQKPLLDHMTLQDKLTEEQLQPLSKREKPQPSENIFPSPLPSQKKAGGAQEYAQFRASTLTPSTDPMLRHTVRTGQKAEWNYTSSERVTPAPKKHAEQADGKPAKRNDGSVPAAVVKMPIDKKPFILGAIAIFLALIIILGCVFGIKPGKSGGGELGPQLSNETPTILPNQTVNTQTVLTDRPSSKYSSVLSPVDPDDPDAKDAFGNEYTTTTAVGYHGEIIKDRLEENEIVKPIEEVKNEGGAFSSEAYPNGNTAYPKFGSTLKSVIGTTEDKAAARGALITESSYLCAWGTAGANRGGEQTPDKYTKIDADGYLYQYKNNEWIHALEWGKTADEYTEANFRRLYKHTFANDLYLGNVSDDEPRVIKEITMRPRGYSSYGVTGIYAPAGEVIKIELSEKDMIATGGITIHIGQALYNGQANNIWVSKNQMSRVPHLLTTLTLNTSTTTYDEVNHKYVGYVGSFLGGPLYIRNESKKFTATITGGVQYRHFILGYTTEAEYKETSKSTAPYFDLEVWDRGVLHSGPVNYAKNFSYNDIYKAAVLWDKVACVTAYSSNQGIVFLYDSFVAAGAAVAFPGRSSVNCPLGWMAQSLNYNTLVTSGSWGNFHEYHHNFQNYGLGSGADGETTNNGLNLVSYALFTKISAKRGIGSYGSQGLGGWNNYTSASWALQRVLTGQITSTNGLAVYATLLHNFGAYAYTYARGVSGPNKYFDKWATLTHHDFTYYAKLTDKYYNGGSNAYSPSAAVKDANYPMFVPVSSVYQTGRSYLYDGEKKYFTTMQPYVIPAGIPFNIDLSRYSAPNGQYAGGSIVIPDGFEYRIKSITQPSNGTIELVDNYNFKYTPDPANKSLRSGQIVVTLEIVKSDGAFEVEETDLILEFEQSHEKNKMTLERTTYTYAAENMYSDAVAAYNANFAGYENREALDHSNPTQNCNTDIWFRPDTDKAHNDYPNEPDKFFIHENQIEVIDGKLYFDDDGKYRVYLRGRTNCAVYFSLDGKNYNLGAAVKNGSGAAFYLSNSDTYFDVAYDEGSASVTTYTGGNKDYTYTLNRDDSGEIRNWLYIKEVLIDTSKGAVSYIGLGTNQWTETTFSIAEKYYNADGAEVDSPDDEAYAYSETTYNDMNGTAVAVSKQLKDSTVVEYYKIVNKKRVESTLEEVSELTESKLIPPTSATYVNAYRNNYQFPNNSGFESEYFYLRSYNYNYTGTPVETFTWNEGVQILDTNFVADTSGDYGIGNLLEEGTTIGHYIHSKSGNGLGKGPIYISLDMGKTVNANSITFYGRSDKDATTAQQGLPKQFKLEISSDGLNYEDAGTFTNGTGAAKSVTVNLGKTITFRYVKITVNSSHSNNNHLILSGIRFAYTFTLTGNGANQIAPDNDSLLFVGNWQSVNLLSTFGYAFVGENGSKVKFEMIGTRLAILTSTLYNGEYEVYIDGNKCSSVDVKSVDGEYGITYISQKLESGKHKVEIYCKGTVGFDSFAIYDEN